MNAPPPQLSDLSNEQLRILFNKFLVLYDSFTRMFKDNNGGMGCSDMFTFFYTLHTLQPKYVIESGVFQGASTWFIRQTLPRAYIFCFDPMEPRYKDSFPMTTYFTGKDFIDFNTFQPEKYNITLDNTLCFFDDHINAPQRLMQTRTKGIKYALFNDNYPVNCGGHLTLKHVMTTQQHNDDRYSLFGQRNEYKEWTDTHIESIVEFPNIIGNSVETGEGSFPTESLFPTIQDLIAIYTTDDETQQSLPPHNIELFDTQSQRYRWNTFIKLK